MPRSTVARWLKRGGLGRLNLSNLVRDDIQKEPHMRICTAAVRLPAPLRVGGRFRLAVEVTAVEPVDAGFQVTFKVVVEVEGGGKPVMTAELLYRYLA